MLHEYQHVMDECREAALYSQVPYAGRTLALTL